MTTGKKTLARDGRRPARPNPARGCPLTAALRPRVAIAACLLAAAFASGRPVHAHGASKGLHVHVARDPVAPGATVDLAVDSADPLAKLTVGFVGGKALTIEPKEPSKRIETRLAAPEIAKGATFNVHAEGITVAGKTVRASAVVPVARTAEPR